MTTPVDLKTVIQSLLLVIGDSQYFFKIYDLAGCEPMTYSDMMSLTARHMGLTRKFIQVPFFTPTLSRLWVSLITNSPKELVYPLIESLEHPMIARKDYSLQSDSQQITYSELIRNINLKPQSRKKLFSFRPQRNTVRSVQRIPLPAGKNAKWIKEQYVDWLPKFLFPFILVKQNNLTTQFCFLSPKICLLELTLSQERSNEDRQLLYITKGLLVSEQNKGRLEFRVILGRRFVMAAIHDFKPSLPWFIYKYTQAILHLFVMNSFKRHLSKYSQTRLSIS